MNENRKIVLDCFENLFVNKDFEAAKAALHPDFVTHNPGLPDGRDAFTEAVKNSPLAGVTAEIKHVAAEDDLVFVHQHVAGSAVVDILRVENGLLVEHWDVKQPLSA
ncbi:nuclear transport factor 2 family protein [Amycolatopsis sp. NPDC098790]|uniref:nuclear transport factor 2 family protein n=1 Tax=Amycolatopsis sp. NPDC098790 TaxID=3363939 RepID=UPI0038108198